MSARVSARREPESAFDHPAFERLYACALRDVADRRLDLAKRKAAARALAFLLREQVVDERVATDVLGAVRRSLDVPHVVRTLLIGLCDVLGDHERIAEWTTAVADRALREGHLASFVTAIRILVGLRDYDGSVPTHWRSAILKSTESVEVPSRVLRYAHAYTFRFPEKSSWLRAVTGPSGDAVSNQSPAAPSAPPTREAP